MARVSARVGEEPRARPAPNCQTTYSLELPSVARPRAARSPRAGRCPYELFNQPHLVPALIAVVSAGDVLLSVAVDDNLVRDQAVEVHLTVPSKFQRRVREIKRTRSLRGFVD